MLKACGVNTARQLNPSSIIATSTATHQNATTVPLNAQRRTFHVDDVAVLGSTLPVRVPAD